MFNLAELVLFVTDFVQENMYRIFKIKFPDENSLWIFIEL